MKGMRIEEENDSADGVEEMVVDGEGGDVCDEEVVGVDVVVV